MMSRVIGYCRVSTRQQRADGNSLEAQREAILSKYPNAEIYEECYTGSTTDRPIFNQIIESMGENDVLVVAKLDRLARNTVEGIQIVKELFKKNSSVHCLNIGLLEDTDMGRFFITVLLAVAELERTQIIERTQTGKAVAKENAKARGEKFIEGRPKVYGRKRLDHALELLSDHHSYKQVSEQTGISISTICREVRRRKAEQLRAESEVQPS